MRKAEGTGVFKKFSASEWRRGIVSDRAGAGCRGLAEASNSEGFRSTMRERVILATFGAGGE
jgi:hypothetical protein